MNFYRKEREFFPYEVGHHSLSDRAYQRPRSHSPTPQPHRTSCSPYKYPYKRYDRESPIYNSSYPHNSTPWKHYNRGYVYNRERNFFQQSASHSFYRPFNKPHLKRNVDRSTDDFNKTANEKPTFVNPDNTVDVQQFTGKSNIKDEQHKVMSLSLHEAEQAYDTDRRTISQVTQLLINEDKDIEDRLLCALENILNKLKDSHENHIKTLKESVTT